MITDQGDAEGNRRVRTKSFDHLSTPTIPVAGLQIGVSWFSEPLCCIRKAFLGADINR
jgi:hypothetical protein